MIEIFKLIKQLLRLLNLDIDLRNIPIPSSEKQQLILKV